MFKQKRTIRQLMPYCTVPLGVMSRNIFSIGQIPSFLSRLRSVYYL